MTDENVVMVAGFGELVSAAEDIASALQSIAAELKGMEVSLDPGIKDALEGIGSIATAIDDAFRVDKGDE